MINVSFALICLQVYELLCWCIIFSVLYAERLMFEVKWIWFDDSVWSQMDFWIIFISCWDQTNDNCVVGEVSYCPNHDDCLVGFSMCRECSSFRCYFLCQPNPWWLIGRSHLQLPLYSWLHSSPTVHCWGFLLFVHLPNSIGCDWYVCRCWWNSI